MTFVRAWICTDDMWASCLQAKGQRGYFSQKIGLVVARSAGTALPPLTLRLFMFPSLPSRLCTFGSPSLDLFSICSTSLTVVKFCPSTGVSKHFLSGCNVKCFEMLLLAKTLLSQEIQLGLPEDGPDYKTPIPYEVSVIACVIVNLLVTDKHIKSRYTQ